MFKTANTAVICLDEVEYKIGNDILPLGASDLWAEVDVSQPDSRYEEDIEVQVTALWFGQKDQRNLPRFLDPKEHGFLWDAAQQHADSMEEILVAQMCERRGSLESALEPAE